MPFEYDMNVIIPQYLAQMVSPNSSNYGSLPPRVSSTRFELCQ